jgi:hypothetical protein
MWEFKEKFMMNDALVNVSNELAFTILHEYKCTAGCKDCRIVIDGWPKKGDLSGVKIPTDDIFHVASHFDMLCTYDDLVYIRKTPHLFEWYKEHEKKFYNSSLTDRAIWQQFDILMDDIDFLGIQELSLFDHFIVNPKLDRTQFKGMEILDVVKLLREKYVINRIKIMITDAKMACSPKVTEVLEYAQDQGMDFTFIGNFLREDDSILLHLTANNFQHFDFYEHDESLHYFIKKGKMWKTDACGLYLQNDRIDTNGVGTGFYDIDNWDATEFLAVLLENKKNNYAKQYEGSGIEFFNSVSKDLIVNKDYNFIPGILMSPYSQFAKKLQSDYGFIRTDYGLLRRDGKAVKPLMEWINLD